MIATVTGVAAFELLLATVGWLPPPLAVAAGPIPAGCVAHTPLGDEDDYVGDYHCAGIAIDYHLGGVARSSGKIWAGQWLFEDQDGEYRLGMCTFNRGGHPRADIPSAPVNQTFPNDPTGTRREYLTWRYGRTTDNLTAAALWAVFHFYAQDAAGSNRASNATSPLVPSLDGIATASGRTDIQDLAKTFDDEAARFTTPFSIAVTLSDVNSGRVIVMAGTVPVANTIVTLASSGAPFEDGSTSIRVTTDADGSVAFTLGDATGDVTVVATSTSPGKSEVYRGVAADPSGVQPQTLLTAGADQQITSSAIALPPTTTTTTVPATATTTAVPESTTTTIPVTTIPATTSVAPTTTVPDTTTTIPETTTIAETAAPVEESTTTVPPESTTTTTTMVEATTTYPTVPFIPFDLEIPAVTSPAVVSLPKTGSSNNVAYFATALLVAGVGVIGAVRRNRLVSDDQDIEGEGGESPGFW
ncbi:MAG: LPXTG cell wall anchor domain-containing protein [Ilumatobacteraceae bacterium]